MAKIKKTTNTKHYKGSEATGNLSQIADGNVKWNNYFEKFWQFLKIKHTFLHLAFDAGISHLGIYPREIKTYTDRKLYIKMFFSSLLHDTPKLGTHKSINKKMGKKTAV